MRATISGLAAPWAQEWLIVARWGRRGEFLSLGRTLVPAPPGTGVPVGLAPLLTAFGEMLPARHPAAAPAFRLARNLPLDISVAGSFLGLDGHVALRPAGARLRLGGIGRSTDLRIWRLRAIREPWADEFLDREPVA